MNPFGEAQEKTSTSLPLTVPRSIQLLSYSALSLVWSMMLPRLISLPWLANLVSSEGLGAAARSGGSPAATRVVRMASWSRLASKFTLIPVFDSNGASTWLKASSSAPDQTPMTFTDPPCTLEELLLLFVAPGAQAAPAMAPKTARTSPLRRLNVRINHPLFFR